jgi:CRP-like cAMP-binding protein
LIQGLRLLSFRPGDIILSEGELGQSLFILTTGCVKVLIRNAVGQSLPLCSLEGGAFFGEIAALSGSPRTATVVAATPCELLELDKPTLDTITQEHPRVREVLERFRAERTASPEAAKIRTLTES